MSSGYGASVWRRLPKPPPLEPGSVHVWRVQLSDPERARALRPLLSDDERARADRFFREEHRIRFTVAHGQVRRILAHYVNEPPPQLRFAEAEHGKPSLVSSAATADVHFNLSHSADLALVAVARAAPVGVDLEQWDDEVEHLALAERFFSEAERRALHDIAQTPGAVVGGFFAAWSRKEAYLKATGHGITRGLHHFDVSLEPGDARLLADRMDANAANAWAMSALDVAPNYSAAVVMARSTREVVLLDVEHALRGD